MARPWPRSAVAGWGLGDGGPRLGGLGDGGVLPPPPLGDGRQVAAGARSCQSCVIYIWTRAARNDGHPAVIWAGEMPRTPVVITINKT